MAAGRPPLFKSDSQLKSKINKYFKSIEGEFHMEPGEDEEGNIIEKKVWDSYPEPATITGLCLFLGFESRQSFHDYAKNEEFSYTIKKARLRIEHEYEKSMNTSKIPTAQIFALKNLGWSDKQEIENNHTLKNFTLKDAINFED